MTKIITVSIKNQEMQCFNKDDLIYSYSVSTGKNGVGEIKDSECTPRGWHKINSIIGMEHQINSVFVARNWTNEIYSEELATQFPDRDWILTRILRLEGLEPGRNQGDEVDTFERYIYIHGTPDSTPLGTPGSRGCIRMNNNAIIELAEWSNTDTLVYIS
jgi:lipoprotein-anchoring transpeptidase ErfK/SrfK